MPEQINEMAELELLIKKHKDKLRSSVLAEVPYKRHLFPLYGIELGTLNKPAPTVIFVGGVHGVERIGCQVVLAFLSSLLERLEWDSHFQQLFDKVRVAFVPVVNPVGLHLNRRANGNGIDLMRNSGLDAQCRTTPLVGGHRISSLLPWYRGTNGQELETQVLCDFVNSLAKKSSFTISLDAHSGFGLQDHVWFPYAGKQTPFENIAHIYRLMTLFEHSYPYHAQYRIAPQCHFYTTHGDIWDYLAIQNGKHLFLPLTLEMGSWLWVKKNPRQLLSFSGLFNPQKKHRRHRILRRHTVLMEFLIQYAYSSENWLPHGSTKSLLKDAATRLWYPKKT